MSQRARVTSVEALEVFRSKLIIYLSQARPAIEEVSAEVVRTRLWLENDQRTYWENQMRRRQKALDEAQQALFSARIGTLRTETSMEQLVVQRAKRSVEEAAEKLRVLKKWNREFDGQAQPFLKQIEKLHTVLTNDMAQALAYLAQAISTLTAYAELQAPPVDSGGAASGGPSTPGTAPASSEPIASVGGGGLP